MNIALYLRVSTDKQTTRSQVIELREYCKRRGWENVREFSDTASGAKFSRQGCCKLRLERLQNYSGRAVAIRNPKSTICDSLPGS